MCKKFRKLPRPIKITCLVLLAAVFLGGSILAGVNAYMIHVAKPRIYSVDALSDFDADCVLVLGAGVRPDGSPSHMLEDRLKTGIALYKNGAAPKLLMSGDHGREHYNEVGTMKAFAITEGIPGEDIFMDHAGFSTYESLYRARDIFQAKRVIIVTQEYHLYRALHIADQLGVEAVGVSADLRPYAGQSIREIREIAARAKDFLYCFFAPLPTYLGDAIPVSGDGNLTND